MKRAFLKPKEDRRITRGHLWAYRNEFAQLPELDDGELVDDGRRFIGRGFYQAQGGIAVRILDRHSTEIDGGFLRKRIDEALALRRQFFPGSNVFRWIHGESDYLPGLIADRFESVVSIQTPCAFYEKNVEALARIFLDHPGVTGVRFTSDSVVKTFGNVPDPIEIALDGIRLGFSLEKGQKTGFFLDQRENSRLLDFVAPGACVLDGYCYAGQWTCRALKAGAASVTAVDTSPPAIEWARRNVEANFGGNAIGNVCRFECSSVEEVLRRGESYNVICLDPPALAKTRSQCAKALDLYQAVNRDALKAVKSGGFLITSSCSQPVDMETFLELLKRAARSAKRRITVLAAKGAPPDHPVLLSMPETSYLKCVLIQVK